MSTELTGNSTADVVVIGGGVFGCTIAYHLAQERAGKVVLLERGQICSGGTAKSCAIVRTHYSVRPNMVHAVESLRIFERFGEIIGGDAGWRRTGYLVVGPEEHREPMQAVFRDQNKLGIDTATLTPDEGRKIHPLVQFDDVDVIGYDTQAGYCDPYLVTTSYARRATELGVNIRTETPVTGLRLHGGVKYVTTPSGVIESPVVVIVAGPWTNAVGAMSGVQFPYTVSRHKVITLRADQPYQPDWPVVKDLTTGDKIYIRPTDDGQALIGTGDHGEPIQDADAMSDHVDSEHQVRISELIARRMPGFANARFTLGWTGAYDIPPDWNPVVGPVPGVEGLYVAVGFSGHGFKLAPTIGEALAQTVLGLEPRVPIDMYAVDRFDEGKALEGAYGEGSIA